MAGKKVDIEQRVTNIYRLQDVAWKLVRHHTDISPAMADVVSRFWNRGRC
jgi:ketosteroid isomerase-like protein